MFRYATPKDTPAKPNASPDDDHAEYRDVPARRTATRADLVERIALTCPNLSRPQTREIFEMVLSEVADALMRGEPVKLRGFGLFSSRRKRERMGRNPRTGVEAPITPRRVLTFKPSPVLVDVVNGQTPSENESER